MIADEGERLVAILKFTVELEVLNLLEDSLKPVPG